MVKITPEEILAERSPFPLRPPPPRHGAGEMSGPVRIQRRRSKGWRMPENCVYVGRPTRWGNPFKLDDWQGAFLALNLGCRGDTAGRRAAAVRLYRLWLCGDWRPVENDTREWFDKEVMTIHPPCFPPTIEEIKLHLAGKNLVCWCPLDGAPCHADVLLEISNGTEPGR